MPNGIGSELEGRTEILRMDQNPDQPAPQPQPPAEISVGSTGGPAGNAAPLQEGDQASSTAVDQRPGLLAASRTLNRTLRELFLAAGTPLRDSSSIFDISEDLLQGNGDARTMEIRRILNDLEVRGTESLWFRRAQMARERIDTDLYLEEGGS